MNKSIEQELQETLNTVRALRAQSPDEIEDYFHDSIVGALAKGKPLRHWMGYIYKTVQRRLSFGKEGVVPYVPLAEAVIPAPETTSEETLIDIKTALHALPVWKREYILEYFYGGWTLEEIAVKHQVSNQYVSRVISSALREMRSRLTTRREGEG